MRTCPLGLRDLLQPLIRGSLLLAVVMAGNLRPLAAASTNSLSLARDFTVERLREILLPREQWHPCPTWSAREAWDGLPESVRTYLVKLGDEALNKPIPALPASLYLEYARQGNRANFEGVYFARRAQLQNLVLAECVEGKGRYLTAATDALWAICEESTWCLPAHVGAQKAKVGLPDVQEPIVDLFAGESAVTVAWTLYLLGSEMDLVSPQIRRRAAFELQQRVLTPVRDRDDFGWMALHVTRPDQRPNNWTPWIAASVLTTSLLSEPDAERRVQTVHKMLRSLDGFVRFYPSDGSCDEGPSYWGRAGGSLLDGLDILHSASGGKFDVFAEPLVQEIGRFIYRAYIADDYFVPIGDCAARFEPERSLVFRYGRRIGDPTLKALAAQGASVPSILGGRFLGRQIYSVFDAGAILAEKPAASPLVRDVWLGSEDLQLMTARSKDRTIEGFYLAAWGGHNAQSHNHNDVGNVLVFADGQPVLVDVGAPTYTAQTFSSKRYEIWAFQSAFHNVPTINGVLQSAGRRYAARDVVYHRTETAAQLQMDIAPAYPEEAQVKSWVRTVRLNRGQSVELTEAFDLRELTGETQLHYLTPMELDVSQPGKVVLFRGQSQPPQDRLRLEYDATILNPSVERIPLTDPRLIQSWGTQLRQLRFHPRRGSLQARWTLRLLKGDS